MALILPVLVQLLHGPPRAINIPKWLMDQVQVQVIELQPLQGPFKSLFVFS